MVDPTLVSIPLALGNEAAGAEAAKHHHFENLARTGWNDGSNSRKALTKSESDGRFQHSINFW